MRRAAPLVLLVAVLTFALASPATATRPDFNPECAGTKIDPVETGSYAVLFGEEVGSVAVTVRDTEAGQVADVATDDPSHLLISAVVKGGTAYEAYSFGTGVTSATDLHAPVNPNSSRYFDISHICLNTADAGGGEE